MSHDVCKAALDAAAKRIEELERENAELRGWKESAEDLWDPQEIGRELDIPVGASIRVDPARHSTAEGPSDLTFLPRRLLFLLLGVDCLLGDDAVVH